MQEAGAGATSWGNGMRLHLNSASKDVDVTQHIIKMPSRLSMLTSPQRWLLAVRQRSHRRRVRAEQARRGRLREIGVGSHPRAVGRRQGRQHGARRTRLLRVCAARGAERVLCAGALTVRRRLRLASLVARESNESVPTGRVGRRGGPLHGAGAVGVRAGTHHDRHGVRAPLRLAMRWPRPPAAFRLAHT